MTAVVGLALRQTRRGAIVVILLCSAMSALVVLTYRATVGADAGALAVLAANPAVRTLFGEPVALDQPGGFTVWRTGMVLAVILGAWGLLTVTRTTRGEEDAGRWDLLLAGPLTLTAVVARHLAVPATVMLVAGSSVGVTLAVAGTDVQGALLHGAGLAFLGVFFVGIGGLAAQVFPARAGATAAAAAVLAVGLLARMVGDGVSALSWLRWTTPFGLVELTRPYEANRWTPLLVLTAAAVAAVGGAVAAAVPRDLRGGWLAPANGRRPRYALLGSIAGFAVRRAMRPVAGWALAIGAYYLLVGLIAKSVVGLLADNPRFADLAAQAGFGGLNLVEGFAATLFGLLAVPVGVFTAVRLAAFAADESERRLALLYAGPVTRARMVAAEVAVTAAGAVLLTLLAGLAAWSGAAVVGAGLGLPDAVAGAVNALPIAALCLGAGVLALGFVPRATAAIGMLPAVGGFLFEIIASSVGAPDWVAELSPFAHLARVPMVAPDWPATAAMTAIAAALGVLGLAGYRRRDQLG